MDLQCRTELGSAYSSRSQIARVLSEDWCGRELYCAACTAEHLSVSDANTPAIDLLCRGCGQCFQLKSSSTWNQKKIVDAAYDSMVRAIRSERVPNLLVMQYSSEWLVKNLLLVPSTFFVETVIEKRRPLGPNARRAGWVGCNILLQRIPQDGKIALVENGTPIAASVVRQEFHRAKRLAGVPINLRGWTLDVLGAIRRLGQKHFSLRELYQLEDDLHKASPQ